METVAYTPDLVVQNLDQLPHGIGAKFLIAIRGNEPDKLYPVYIAKRWARKLPTTLQQGEIVIKL